MLDGKLNLRLYHKSQKFSHFYKVIKKDNFIFNFICTYVPSAQKSSDSLRLELHLVVSYPVSAGN